jgi:transposase
VSSHPHPLGRPGPIPSPRSQHPRARHLAPKINQSGDRSRTGALSKAGSRTLRWAAVEAAQHAWRPTNPWHQLYTDLAKRAGKNPAKAAVARKILIAAWHVLSRQQPFKPAAPRRPDPVSASSRCFLAA